MTITEVSSFVIRRTLGPVLISQSQQSTCKWHRMDCKNIT